MLETIREFGLERLAASGEEASVRRLHAAYVLDMVERQDGLMPRPDRWWEPFEAEWANIRAVLAWAVVAGETGIGLRLGGRDLWLLDDAGAGWRGDRLAAAAAGGERR